MKAIEYAHGPIVQLEVLADENHHKKFSPWRNVYFHLKDDKKRSSFLSAISEYQEIKETKARTNEMMSDYAKNKVATSVEEM
jgi:hypothetical protein